MPKCIGPGHTSLCVCCYGIGLNNSILILEGKLTPNENVVSVAYARNRILPGSRTRPVLDRWSANDY